MNNFFRQLRYKELFLVGFYVSFISITFIAGLIDIVIQNYFDAVLDFIFVGISALFYIHFLSVRNHTFAARAIFWIATSIVFIFVVHSQFNMSVIFTVLLPIVAFVLMPPLEILKNMLLYYLILSLLFIYGYFSLSNNFLLHSEQNLTSYFIATLFSIAFGLFYTLAIEESYRRLEDANRQKEILLKEIHHRIKNNLNVISSILGLQKLESNHPEIDSIIDQNKLRIESISLAHEILYMSSDIENIEFKTYVQKLVHQIFVSMSDETFKLEIESESHSFNLEMMAHLGIVINELVTNSIKYAPMCDGSCIFICLTQKEGSYYLEYRDSGSQQNSEVLLDIEALNSLGINLIKLTVEQMQGEVKIYSNYHYKIRFST